MRADTLLVLLALLRAPAEVVPAVSAPAASGTQLDRERAAWRFRRAVELPAEARGPLAELPLPPELWTGAQGDLRDLRLLDATGRELPFVVDRQARRESAPSWNGALVDARREAKQHSEWVVDLGEPRTFDQVSLDVPDSGFAKRLRVEASDDRASWRLLRDDAGIFERDWQGALRHTRVELAEPASARYLRLSTDDRHSAPIDVTAVRVEAVRRLGEARWSREAALEPAPSPQSDTSVVKLVVPAGLPIETVTLDAFDAAFSRSVRLIETGPTGERLTRGSGQLYRVRLDDQGPSSESLRFDVVAPGSGTLELHVRNGASPPLRDLRVTVSGTRQRLIFTTAPGALTLYYGNRATRAPHYDLDVLREHLAFAPAFASARLGDESPNPLFAPAAPLAALPSTGATLDVARWRAQRPLALTGPEDVYSLTLGAQDLGRLRDDLADLRLIDAQGRQVPYVVEPDAADKPVTLTVERLATRPGRDDPDAARRSVYRLTPDVVVGVPGAAGVPAVGALPRPLPWQRLELQVPEGFFTRPARLLAPGEDGRREVVLWQGQLARTAGPSLAPLVIALDGRRHATLQLEIDEGDNAPLTLARAEAIVRVPRLTFKARAGFYRVLLDRPDAEAPRYDSNALRGEMLAYSSVPVAAAAPEDNPAYRRRAADYLVGAPPTLVLWGTLLAAVVGLVVLTARVLGKAAA